MANLFYTKIIAFILLALTDRKTSFVFNDRAGMNHLKVKSC